jgi:uncharacterized membrane protein YqiK
MASGSYDVEMEQGPAYATKREQAQASITEFIRAFPPAAPLIGDIYAKIMDMPHAEEIGERLEEALPPPIKAKLQQERAEAEQASGKPPSPEMQQQAQAQAQAQQEAEAAKKLQFEMIQAQTAKAVAEAKEAEAKARKAEAEAQKAIAEAEQIRVDTAGTHMQNLRDIRDSDAEFDREDQSHRQGMRHAQDHHEIDITLKGFGERRAQEQHQRGGEKHQATIKNMTAPREEMVQ